MNIFFVLLAFLVAGLLLIRKLREYLVEELKALSDYLLLLALKLTSQFGNELTKDGLAEQKMWRELRLRDLRGLALRSRERQRRLAEESREQ